MAVGLAGIGAGLGLSNIFTSTVAYPLEKAPAFPRPGPPTEWGFRPRLSRQPLRPAGGDQSGGSWRRLDPLGSSGIPDSGARAMRRRYGIALAWIGVRIAARAADQRLPELCQIANLSRLQTDHLGPDIHPLACPRCPAGSGTRPHACSPRACAGTGRRHRQESDAIADLDSSERAQVGFQRHQGGRRRVPRLAPAREPAVRDLIRARIRFQGSPAHDPRAPAQRAAAELTPAPRLTTARAKITRLRARDASVPPPAARRLGRRRAAAPSALRQPQITTAITPITSRQRHVSPAENPHHQGLSQNDLR